MASVWQIVATVVETVPHGVCSHGVPAFLLPGNGNSVETVARVARSVVDATGAHEVVLSVLGDPDTACAPFRTFAFDPGVDEARVS